MRLDEVNILELLNRSGYNIENVTEPFPGIKLIKLQPYNEMYGIAENEQCLVEYAETLLFDQLENEPDIFDGEWILKFASGDYWENMESLPSEYQKHDYCKFHGVDVCSAMKDHRNTHKSTIHWLESVLEAHCYSLRYNQEGVFYWRRG